MSAATSDLDLDALLSDARAALDQAIDDELAVIAPDLPAIVDEVRARGLDLDDAPPLAACGLDLDAPRGLDAPLEALLAEARREADADVAARGLLPRPAPPLPASPPAAGARRVRWLGAAFALAAAVALLWGLQPFLARQLADADATASQAHFGEREDAAGPTPASELTPPEEAGRRARRRLGAPLVADPADAVLSDMSEETSSEEAAAAGPVDADADADPDPDADDRQDPGAPVDPREAPRARRDAAPEGPLSSLEAEAEARWRDGDLAGAEAVLRRITRSGADRQRVDLAYGDLFAVTRQRSGREAEAAVWTEYLRRFPRGRYADDARAGLCRRSEGEDAGACWRRYLDDFPRGSHRAEAERPSKSE